LVGGMGGVNVTATDALVSGILHPTLDSLYPLTVYSLLYVVSIVINWLYWINYNFIVLGTRFTRLSGTTAQKPDDGSKK